MDMMETIKFNLWDSLVSNYKRPRNNFLIN